MKIDHKPLVSLLGIKPLDNLPPRIVRFRLRLMRYHFSVQHIPGKDLITADARSRAQIPAVSSVDQVLQAEVEVIVATISDSLPGTNKHLASIRAAQIEDETCRVVAGFCKKGWPTSIEVSEELKPYFEKRGEFSFDVDGLLLCGQCIVTPNPLCPEVLQQLHSGHQGITKCRERAKQSVWWPGLSSHIIAKYVESCSVCAQSRKQHAEPLLPSSLPDLPWQRVAADFFEFKSHTYLLVVDYYSHYIEVALMSSTTTSQTILHLRSIFARHGVPEELVSDNGPQFSS